MLKAIRVFLTAATLVLFPVLSHSAEFEIATFRFAGGGVSAGGRFIAGGTLGETTSSQPLLGGAWSLTGNVVVDGNLCVSADADGQTNLDDYRRLEPCLTGSGQSIASGCACFDLNGNGAIDLRDFSLLQIEFVAP